MNLSSGQLFRLVVMMIGAMGVYLLYYPALSGPFLLDDLDNIESAALHNLGWPELMRVATSNDSGSLGRPLPVLSLALNQYFSGYNTASFKVINLALHLVNGLILYQLLKYLIRAASRVAGVRSSSIDLDQRCTLIAGSVAFLWLIHPLQISSVMYVVQRMNIMSTGFALLALLVYVRLRLNVVTGHIEFWVKLAKVALFVVLATLSKENGILVLVYLLCVEWMLFRFSAQAGIEQQSVLKWLYCVGVIVGVMLVGYLILNPEMLLKGYVRRDFTLTERLMTQPFVVWNYLGQILIPRIDQMSLYQDSFPVIRKMSVSVFVAISGFVIMILLAFCFVRRLPLVSLGISLYLTSHLVESTFIPLEMSFEHRNYFGLFGVLLSVVWLVASSLQSRNRYWPRFFYVAVVLVLGVQTWQRAIEWSSELTHNTIAAENRPDSRRAQISYSNTLARLGRVDEAIDVLNNGRRSGIDPVYFSLATLNLKSRFGRVDSYDVQNAAQSLAQNSLTVSHAHLLLDIHRNVKRGLVIRPDSHELIALFEAVQKSPLIRLNERGRATLLRHLAELLVAAERWDEAADVVRRALVVNGTDVQLLALETHIGKQTTRAEID